MAGMKYSYAHQNLSMAIGTMAASSRPLRKRLEIAFISHLLKLRTTDFPEELWQRFIKIRSDATSLEPEFEGQGALQATLNRTNPVKIKKMIDELSSIEFLLAHVYFNDASEEVLA